MKLCNFLCNYFGWCVQAVHPENLQGALRKNAIFYGGAFVNMNTPIHTLTNTPCKIIYLIHEMCHVP